MHLFLILALALQQHPQVPTTAATSPASGDTIGYWQQDVHYTIVAKLDEEAQKVHARGTLVYVNHSPDTLREMYVHQYLNAFRPHSKWSDVDTREGRTRFQNLQDPDYGYERFTSTPTFDGVAVSPVYPGAPDSTVVHFVLPKPLAPGDSVNVTFEWDARAPTTPRRNGHKGRSWDFAQWFPKVAVYDRRGWEPNPLVPAGEFYGEFGTYDVTFVVKKDQVLAATGVPVSGDPGWARVKRGGTIYSSANAYKGVPAAPAVEVPDGYRAVRFYARNVHTFAWSASPDYLYEGGMYVRRVPRQHFATWDTVAVNVLYRPGDERGWGNGQVVERTISALKWLESIWGPYAYPQMTNIHRIEGGGTEFPMLIMDGGPDLGLILHEGGHVFTFGILANNEWRSGWMDEGLTSYQTAWSLGQTPQEWNARVAAGDSAAHGPAPLERLFRFEASQDMRGMSQPIGTPAYAFRTFGIYNDMIYNRGELMYSQLRDALGDETFRKFFHDYYSRWALKHVDELAMQASAERASGQKLDWFFDQWIHHTGTLDYAITKVKSVPGFAGGWVTMVTVERRGSYRHPMPVGVRTSAGWTIARIDPMQDVQTINIDTKDAMLEVRLDPLGTTWDWNRFDDTADPVGRTR